MSRLDHDGIEDSFVDKGSTILYGSDLKPFNTFEQPRNVALQRLEPPAAPPRMMFKLPPRSYTVAQVAVTA